MTRNGGMRNGVVISTCLHVAFLLLLYFGLPTLFKPLPLVLPPPPLTIVEVAQMTNTRVKEDPEEEAKPAPKAPDTKPTPPPETKPPEPQQKPPEPQPKPPEPEEQAEAPVPKPPTKPKPPEPPKPKTDDLASILKNVAKLKPPPSKADEKAPDKTKAAEAKSMAPSLSDRLTISEEDALRRQLSLCWNIPSGARNAETLIVEVVIQVNPDRTVQAAQLVDESRASSDPFYRAAAESALRALRNPRCNPLELPADKYEQWKTIHFTFDPRDML